MPRGGAAQSAAERPFWRPFRALLQLHAVEALGHREFRLLWLGHSFTSMAFWMDQVARGWLIYELTDSALQLGLVRGVQAIPTLLLSPVAGSTADRYSRKTQILIAQVIDGLMLAAFTRPFVGACLPAVSGSGPLCCSRWSKLFSSRPVRR